MQDADNDLALVTRKPILDLPENSPELKQRINDVIRLIKAWADNDESARWLMTIPGIIPLSTTALIAAVDDARQFLRGGIW